MKNIKQLLNNKILKTIPFVIILSVSSLSIIYIKLFALKYNIFSNILIAVVLLSSAKLFLSIVYNTMMNDKKINLQGLFYIICFVLLICIIEFSMENSIKIPLFTYILTIIFEKSCENFKELL
ncbi:TPA: hypothetical protein ACGO2H_002032 [Streptococcus suis]|nr:hypothetical protein [Streptococcus suis]NQH96547.1 hypothetical protein [Streptococcus suis]